MASRGEKVLLDVSGREVTVTNPGKVYFPEAGITKLELVQYYLSVNPVKDTGDRLLVGSRSVPILAPGADSPSGVVALTVPIQIGQGGGCDANLHARQRRRFGDLLGE